MDKDTKHEPFSQWITKYVIIPLLVALIGAGAIILSKQGSTKDPSQDSNEIAAKDGFEGDKTPMPTDGSKDENGFKFDTVKAQEIITTSYDARITAGDNEIDSDDWTSVYLRYSVSVSGDRKSVFLDLDWHSQERNRDKSKGDTTIRSSRRFTLYEVSDNKMDYVIKLLSGIEPTGSREQFYRGEVHGLQSFPQTGSLSEIKVAMDTRGRNDKDAQRLEATVSSFTVELERRDYK